MIDYLQKITRFKKQSMLSTCNASIIYIYKLLMLGCVTVCNWIMNHSCVLSVW